MGTPIDFPGSNLNLMAHPNDRETVSDMPAFTNGQQIVECWQLSEDEIREIVLTGCVWLALAGKHIPPLIVGSKSLIRSHVADCGAWKENEPTKLKPNEPPNGKCAFVAGCKQQGLCAALNRCAWNGG